MKQLPLPRRRQGGIQPDKRGDVRPEDVSFAATTSIGPICLYCTRFRGRDHQGLRCEAFPDAIPMTIWTNQADHRLPVIGDHGLQFHAATHDDLYQAERTMRMARLGGPLPEETNSGTGRE